MKSGQCGADKQLMKMDCANTVVAGNGATVFPGSVSRQARGFSLIEMMVVLTILVVLLGIGAPAFIDTVKNNRMLTEVYALRATLATARSEALARRVPVTVCESSDAETCASDTTSWITGYLAFADADGDGAPDPNEIFVSRQLDVPADMTLFFRDLGGTAVSTTAFSTRGDSLGQNGTFTLCDDRLETEARALNLLPSGEVRVAVDTDDPVDNIVDTQDDDNVDCPDP